MSNSEKINKNLLTSIILDICPRCGLDYHPSGCNVSCSNCDVRLKPIEFIPKIEDKFTYMEQLLKGQAIVLKRIEDKLVFVKKYVHRDRLY